MTRNKEFENLAEYALTGRWGKKRGRKKKTVKLLDTGHKNETIAEKLDKKSTRRDISK